MKTISDHLLDIVQNSVRVKAKRIEVTVAEDRINDFYTIHVKDNGCGMDNKTAMQAANPFFTSRTTRKVGLGLSLLKQNAMASNGSFAINSEIGKGTQVQAVFQLSHLDRPPAGDIWESIYLLIVSNPHTHLLYCHRTGKGVFELDSDELRHTLDGMSLQQADIKKGIIEMIRNNLEEIEASK